MIGLRCYLCSCGDVCGDFAGLVGTCIDVVCRFVCVGICVKRFVCWLFVLVVWRG